MKRNPAKELLDSKAFEIAYAVFRVAENSPFYPFTERVENQAMKLLDDSISGKYTDAELTLHLLKHFIQLGTSVGFVHIGNANTLLEEIEKCNAVIAGLLHSAKVEPVVLDGLFSRSEEIAAQQIEELKSNGPSPEDIRINEELHAHGEEESGQNGQGMFKIAMRHSAILSKIRQSGNLPAGKAGCRLKEIQEVLPEISERTLRYDLQKLSEQGLVERVGSGGPATYYKVRS